MLLPQQLSTLFSRIIDKQPRNNVIRLNIFTLEIFLPPRRAVQLNNVLQLVVYDMVSGPGTLIGPVCVGVSGQ